MTPHYKHESQKARQPPPPLRQLNMIPHLRSPYHLRAPPRPPRPLRQFNRIPQLRAAF